MSKLNAPAAAVLVSAVILGAATPSFADDDAWVAAGAGFAVGTLVGAAAANADTNVYYGPAYAYTPVYAYPPGYVYAPGYVVGPVYASTYVYDYPPHTYPAVTYGYVAGPVYAYAPTRAFAAGGDVGIHSYINGEYVGSDPDPRVRAALRREARGE